MLLLLRCCCTAAVCPHLCSPESQGVVSGVVFVIVLIFLQLQYAADNRVRHGGRQQRQQWGAEAVVR